jgi:hypothetical protein
MSWQSDVGAHVLQKGLPVFWRQVSSGAKAGAEGAFLPLAKAIFSISFLLGMRQLAGRSVMFD